MDLFRIFSYAKNNFLFWLSRKIDYPLLPPDMVQINFTYRCNLRCKMCNMYDRMEELKKQGKQVELDTPTIKKVIKDSKKMGVTNVLFIGGEPLLKPDLFDLVDYSKSLNLNTVIVTNATLLDKYIDKIAESKVDCLSISMDAATDKTLTKIRGNRVFNKILKNLSLLKKKKSPTLVAVCTIMEENQQELLKIAKLCKRLGFSKILYQPVVSENTDQTKRKALTLDSKSLDREIDKLISYKRNYGFIGNSFKNLRQIKEYFRGTMKNSPCYAGFNRIQIVQEGKIYFCVNQKDYEATFGDINKDSLKEMWHSKKAKEYRRIIKNCESPCLQLCTYREDFFYLEDLLEPKIKK